MNLNNIISNLAIKGFIYLTANLKNNEFKFSTLLNEKGDEVKVKFNEDKTWDFSSTIKTPEFKVVYFSPNPIKVSKKKLKELGSISESELLKEIDSIKVEE